MQGIEAFVVLFGVEPLEITPTWRYPGGAKALFRATKLAVRHEAEYNLAADVVMIAPTPLLAKLSCKKNSPLVLGSHREDQHCVARHRHFV